MKNIYKILSLVLFPTYLFADGLAKDWQLSFQEPASPLMEELINFHSVVFWIITVITIFVFLLLAYVCYKFSAKKKQSSK
jgi:cytochrome c oxidase subunit 2